MNKFFLIITLLIPGFMFSEVSYGQKRKSPLKVQSISIKTIEIAPICNSNCEVVEDINYILYCTTKKDQCVSNEPYTVRELVCYFQYENPEKWVSLGQIIYFNDLLYKEPKAYFQWK